MGHFNPRIPYGMRLCHANANRLLYAFQSTHPVWDATFLLNRLHHIEIISIHASRMGCDVAIGEVVSENTLFQSTHPVWDATRHRHPPLHRNANFNPRIPYGMRLGAERVAILHEISIHASRMGCDPMTAIPRPAVRYFNPRIPYGMRPTPWRPSTLRHHFNPRIPYGMRP